MNVHVKRFVAVAAAVSLAAGLAACGDTGESDERSLTIGVLSPGPADRRWLDFDEPLIAEAIKKLCGDCTVDAAEAQDSPVAQQQQVDTMIINGVDVIVLIPVDARSIGASVQRAHQANIPVVAYDRLAEGPVSAYVSFDNVEVGRVQGEALLKALGDRPDGAQIVMMNGSDTDPNSASFEKGALSALKGRVKIGRSYNTPEWRTDVARANMSGAIASLGPDGIDGVYAASDGLATGIVSALKAANVKPFPPITGQDAELSALQRIVAGEQYMTVYKNFKVQADAAAKLALALGRGESIDDLAKESVSSRTVEDIPAVLLSPVSVTVDNVDTVVKDGLYTIEQICTSRYRTACEEASLLAGSRS
ncbi:substrate-binding domain-containing protein [Streptomyces sp. NPDC002896]|uniref:substrate-binding domain-containing protein n=1 Tax=Streptomyces sp. NPDC002896 TaxID=3154438 RepID=UPI00332B1A1F